MRPASGIILILLGLLNLVETAPAQPPPTAVGIGFRNDLNVPVIVQGWSVIKGMQRRGQPVLVNPKRSAWDNNVPAGIRYISVYDANQPSKILLRDRPTPVRNQDQFYGILPVPGDTTRVVLQQEPVPR